jgi:hypothetical protein
MIERMVLTHDLGRSLTLARPDGQVIWRYVYSGKPKPYFHPVSTPLGVCLTNFEPHDHVWHRGLWFTFKFINGENFWEENPPFGTQETVAPPEIAHPRQGRIEVASTLRWLRPGGAGVVLEERRILAHQEIDEGAYAIDLTTRLRAQADVLLDRTPFGTWGGYGGLVFRGTRNWQRTQILLSDGSTTERPTGQRALWADLSGRLDGGPGLSGGFAMLDHPSNARHPSPWYGGAEKHQNYLNAALLFHEPLRLEGGRSLSLRYRVVVHDGMWTAQRIAREHERFAAD